VRRPAGRHGIMSARSWAVAESVWLALRPPPPPISFLLLRGRRQNLRGRTQAAAAAGPLPRAFAHVARHLRRPRVPLCGGTRPALARAFRRDRRRRRRGRGVWGEGEGAGGATARRRQGSAAAATRATTMGVQETTTFSLTTSASERGERARPRAGGACDARGSALGGDREATRRNRVAVDESGVRRRREGRFSACYGWSSCRQ
jgi:hypothetical protein